MQANYDFRQEMLRWHRPNLRNPNYRPESSQTAVEDFSIVILKNAGEVLITAAKDLQDYLFTSMECAVPLRSVAELSQVPAKAILVATAEQLGAQWPYEPVSASYEITVEENRITVMGFNARGCAQGCYQLEDRMNRIRAPYLTQGQTHFAPAFSPRMTHSGYGQEIYPEQHLSAIAHAGMDAILLFVKDVDLTQVGYLDFNNTIRQAAKYGLDVYAYSKMKSNMHPEDPRAFAHYNSTYGKLFKNCPGFKGVVLVGESVEFPSKDPHVSPLKYYENTIDGLPTGKPSAGWYPCYDYPQWLEMLQKVIYPHRPDADIVFWTYNWGKSPEAERLALIDTLPKGISLMATFEMFHVRQMEGFKSYAADYTISFPEAGPYFLSEAKRAKERGIRLYTQANCGGLTWDYGVIPYDPFPELWVRRYQSMRNAWKEFGLCGVMECHHFGFWPSFISQIEKIMFAQPFVSGEEAIRAVAEELYGPENLEDALHAWHLLSQSHTYYPCANEDQYGPFRIGPSYPFILDREVTIPKVPYAIHGGNGITIVNYAYSRAVNYAHESAVHLGFRQNRIGLQIKSLETMRELQQQARAALEAIAARLEGVRKEDCLRLCNMIRFMEHTATTAIHAKRWAILRWKFYVLTEKAELQQWVDDMTALAKAEIANAEATIPIVEADSRLGWEPSMEYIGDAFHLRWKIRQVTQVIEMELSAYQRVIDAME